MKEFRAAHSKMFGQTSSSKSTSVESCKASASESNPSLLSNCKDKLNKPATVNKIGSKVNEHKEAETVTILRTTSPSKKTVPAPVIVKQKPPAPPIPGPIVTISSYGVSDKKSRFLMNESKNIKSESSIQPNESSSVSSSSSSSSSPFNEINQGFGPNASVNNQSKSVNEPNGLNPISIKINYK